MKIIVTGKNGQLGSELKYLSEFYSNINFWFTDRNELDISKEANIIKAVILFSPDVIINCAAFTSVDLAEEQEEFADLANHIGPKNLANICAQNNIRLIHISTDYVFDGLTKVPYSEKDLTNPINVYGKTKLLGEKAIFTTTVNAVIIRTSWVYSNFGNNFVKTMIKLGNERDSINVVNDQFGSPTNANDLAKVCLKIALSPEKWTSKTEIYHYSNDGVISWFDFATEIMKLFSNQCKVFAVSSDSYITKAKRPTFSAMNKFKISNTYCVEIPHWKKSLQEFNIVK